MKQYLTFFIGDEEYAVEILRVREIIEHERVTHVPTMPAHVRGVINLRGTVLPVIDLARKFGGGETATTRTTCIVVVETTLHANLIAVGLVASAVSEVVDIRHNDVEPPPAFGTSVRADFLTGMGKVDNRLLLILDLDRVLTPVELIETLDAADAVAAEHEPSATTSAEHSMEGI